MRNQNARCHYKARLFLVHNKKVAFNVRHPDNDVKGIEASVPYNLCDGYWDHVVGTYNRFAVDGNRFKLYVDGVRIAARQGADKPILRSTDQSLWLARWENTYYNGRLDEIKVFNYELSQSTVQAMYTHPDYEP